MTGSRVEERLAALGLELPPPYDLPPGQRPSAARLVRDGDHVYLSGNGPLWGGEVVYRGKLGADLTREQGYEAARLTALNQLRSLVDEGVDLDRLRWLKVLGMVNSAPDFTDQPAVVNGFSDLVLELFGPERGMHARSAVGMASLPMGIAVEIEALCRLE